MEWLLVPRECERCAATALGRSAAGFAARWGAVALLR
jgi:hypothetical protein